MVQKCKAATVSHLFTAVETILSAKTPLLLVNSHIIKSISQAFSGLFLKFQFE